MESKQRLLLDLQIAREVVDMLHYKALIDMDKIELMPIQKDVIRGACQKKQAEIIDRALALYEKESK